jgi:hypothetical protein
VAGAIAATTVVGVSPASASQFIVPAFGTDQGWQGDSTFALFGPVLAQVSTTRK